MRSPGAPYPGVRALHVTRVGGGCPRDGQRQSNGGQSRGRPATCRRAFCRESEAGRRTGPGAAWCRLVFQAGYKTGAGRSDLGKPTRSRPHARGPAPGREAAAAFIQDALHPRARESAPAGSLRPRDAQAAVSRKPARSARPRPSGPTTWRAPAAPARGRCLSQQRGPRGPAAPPGGPALLCACSLGAGRGPLDFRWRRGTLCLLLSGEGWPPAAGIQQHLDLRGGAGGARRLRAEAPPEGPRAATTAGGPPSGAGPGSPSQEQRYAVAHPAHPCLPRGPVPDLGHLLRGLVGATGGTRGTWGSGAGKQRPQVQAR